MKLSKVFQVLTAVFLIGGFVPVAVAMIGGTWVTYNNENSGLASNDVRAIIFDNNGAVWFGTANGLSKFHGVTWKTYTTADKLAHNTVNAFAHEVGSYGEELWVGTDGGVSVLGVKPDAVTFATPYTTTNAKYPGMISDKITSAVVDSQHVRWFGTDKGLMSFNGTVWKSYTTADNLADNHINAIAYEETKYGPEIWVGTNNGISVVNTKIDAVSFATPYRTTNTKYPGMISDMVFSATVDSKRNTRWFGTDKGVIAFGASSFKSYTTNDFLFNNHVTSVAVNADSTVYFGTSGAGVSRLDGVTGASPIDTDWSGIASNNVRAVAVNKHGVIWFATDNGVTKWIPEGIIDRVNEPAQLPVEATVRGVYPNPFNPSTTIEFTLRKTGYVTLSIYNLAGQKIHDLKSGMMNAGTLWVVWDGKNKNGRPVSSGVYFAQLRSGNTVVNRKMTLAK
ncbi:MAG: two-component regulator propeller domain-containing protein [Candidatus Latescibacterota bacterium]